MSTDAPVHRRRGRRRGRGRRRRSRPSSPRSARSTSSPSPTAARCEIVEDNLDECVLCRAVHRRAAPGHGARCASSTTTARSLVPRPGSSRRSQARAARGRADSSTTGAHAGPAVLDASAALNCRRRSASSTSRRPSARRRGWSRRDTRRRAAGSTATSATRPRPRADEIAAAWPLVRAAAVRRRRPGPVPPARRLTRRGARSEAVTPAVAHDPVGRRPARPRRRRRDRRSITVDVARRRAPGSIVGSTTAARGLAGARARRAAAHRRRAAGAAAAGGYRAGPDRDDLRAARHRLGRVGADRPRRRAQQGDRGRAGAWIAFDPAVRAAYADVADGAPSWS